ncbi:MATE family efflux transporter [uncultured Thomasclavelia sp.]|uniref:MATE family efflux transporter n=1 Tax=uncultured Thomasclavelia sp. TaxID=3025759 RepID=UPI0025FF6536|nr:MATE family efflux transporter [uncultured Thomasclavelia sp.]
MEKQSYLKEYSKYTSLNVLGMIGLSCYILADTFFVSKSLGANGLTALNLAIPIYSFINGSGLMIGMGGGIKYSIFKSQNNDKNANSVFTQALMLTLIIALTFFIIGICFTGNIVKMLGANEEVYSMCYTYLQIILLFAPMFMLNNLLLCFVRNDGAPQLSMAAMIGGSLSNIILDYVFMFPFNMGIFGAVLATGLAPVISMMILSPFFIKKKNHFKIIKERIAKLYFIEIVSGGLPSLITEVSSGIVMIVFNTIILQLAGNTGVAAYGVIANLSLVVISIYTGISQGIQPLLSNGYGLKNIKKVKTIFKYALITVVIVSMTIYLIIIFNNDTIVKIFNSENNPLLQEIGQAGLKIYFIGCLFAGFNIVSSIYFTATEHSLPAHIISLLRGFIIIIPTAFLLANLFKMTGVWATFPVTEIIVSLISIVFIYQNTKKFLK